MRTHADMRGDTHNPLGWQIRPTVSLYLQSSVSNRGKMSAKQNQRPTGPLSCLRANSHCSRPMSITGGPFVPGPHVQAWDHLRFLSHCSPRFEQFWFLSSASLWLPVVLMTSHLTFFLSSKARGALGNTRNLFLILRLPKPSWGNNTGL